jgi:hypothetical protein
MPAEKTVKGIAPQQQTERMIPQFTPYRGEGVDRIGAASPLKLTLINTETWLPLCSGLHHGEALGGCCLWLITMHGVIKRNEANFTQAKTLFDIERNTQMSVVDGVEGAAEDAYHLENLTTESYRGDSLFTPSMHFSLFPNSVRKNKGMWVLW